MNHLQHLVSNKETFFNFMKQNYPFMLHSNVFFRDLQYAINAYFEMKEAPINYSTAETIAKEFIDKLVEEGYFFPIDKKTWRVDKALITDKDLEGVNNE